ncbi:RiPP maturation radical SAM C-methyltransferase [Micromonospora sp. LOL_024]|uniref:RiPP maturation radical SAM C-methyltransferase n=1 Tax=Micromonospora sp. LOL_024 TaxID=3345412 RepID=UPI003A88F647
MTVPLPLVDSAARSRWERAGPQERRALPVVLVTMPFMDVDRPSIQLGLLAAVLREQGFPARTLHANLDFAARIGTGRFGALGSRRSNMVADWLFSVEAFGDAAPDPKSQLVDELGEDLSYLGGPTGRRRDELLRIRREEVPAYLDELMESYPWDDARVVGFTSTFQQNNASFALARRLKQRHPELVTVFGGANFDGEMGPEWVRAVDWVDVAVVGEGEVTLPRILHALATGISPAGIPGTACRVDGAVVTTPPEPPMGRLDDLPLPEYAEFFDRAGRLGLLPGGGSTVVRLPFESARGCWWGAKHHCTFCGLNGSTMRFRAKSPGRVADELASMTRTYGSFRFEAVDNILDMAYLTGLLPVLIEQEAGYDIFYEVKANLTRTQVRTLAHGGVTHVQPGIESLSSHVLELMRKGVRAAQNVNLLRWAAHYGIQVSWNIIWGFPGEREQDYAEQAAVMRHLVHLRPPISAGRVWVERFSPLYAASPTKTPESGYRHVYPADVDLRRVAYFFDYDLPGSLPDATYDGIRDAIAAWTAAWAGDRRPVLWYRSTPGFVQIYDGRHEGAEGTYTFRGALADLYVACSDRPVSAAAASARLDHRLPVEAVREALDEFARRGLVFLDGTLAVALALPAGPPR